MLELRGVSKSFGERAVIAETTLIIAAHERVALIGPSGSGKSTLLKMMLGLVWPDRGEVRVAGQILRPENARAVRRRVGYVIQDGGLFPHLSARDNVTLVAKLEGHSEPRRRGRVDELSDLARLPKRLLDRYPGELSGGERQRVGLMRALMLDPDVLLLDEPLGALDPIIRAKLQEDLRDVFEALGKCVVIVTHDMGEAAYLAPSICVMRKGVVVQRGDMQALVHEPAHPFVAEFVQAQRSLTEALR